MKHKEKESRHKYSRGAVLPKRNRAGWYYHPFEISISGFSGSGKTTLISALIRKLKERGIDPAYIKHDAHRFSMDKEDKDTYRAFQAGARSVFIRDRTHNAVIMDGDFDEAAMEQTVLRSDCLLIEGNKHSDIPKIFMLGPHGEGIDFPGLRQLPGPPKAPELPDSTRLPGPPGHKEEHTERDSSILAAAGPGPLLKHVSPDCRTMDRDDIDGIHTLIMEYFHAARPPLYGLILIGGESKRMGRDKAALVYRNGSQAERALELIRPRCGRCFFSVRPDQSLEPGARKAVHENSAELIPDRFTGIGPMGGILSAQFLHPRAAWLVLGVDMPLLEERDIQELLNFRNPFKFASCFGTDRDKEGRPLDYLLPEPLCAVYEPKSHSRMLALLGRGIDCPRAFLRASDIAMKKPEREDAAFNANSPEQRALALSRLEKNREKNRDGGPP